MSGLAIAWGGTVLLLSPVARALGEPTRVSGAPAMAFFVWRRDLLTMIVFHTITDAIGLVIAPLYSDWWKSPALS